MLKTIILTGNLSGLRCVNACIQAHSPQGRTLRAEWLGTHPLLCPKWKLLGKHSGSPAKERWIFPRKKNVLPGCALLLQEVWVLCAARTLLLPWSLFTSSSLSDAVRTWWQSWNRIGGHDVLDMQRGLSTLLTCPGFPFDDSVFLPLLGWRDSPA